MDEYIGLCTDSKKTVATVEQKGEKGRYLTCKER